MKKKITQLRWLAATLMFVAAMVMPSTAWAQSYDTNGFGSDESDPYLPATLITGTYDIDDDGTKDNVYEIGNAGQLYWFAGLINGTLTGITQDKSANAVLAANITVNTGVLNENGDLNAGTFRSWTPIGGYYNSSNVYYSGTFDGNNYTISGLYYNEKIVLSGELETAKVGLFGNSKGTIKNVAIIDSYFKLDLSGNFCYLGGICGCNANAAVIENCNFTGTVVGTGTINYDSGKAFVGGVSGTNSGEIKDCFNAGKVTAEFNGDYVELGGVCGWNNKNGTIERSYNAGNVIDQGNTNSDTGGVCGKNIGIITNSYNEGIVSGGDIVGGICGMNDNNSSDAKYTIANCYNRGTVSGGRNCRNLVGLNWGSTRTQNCYYLADTPTAEAKNAAQFASGEVAYLLSQGCTIEDVNYEGSVWKQNIDNGAKDAYPILDSSHGTVYASTPCPINFSNTDNFAVEEHNYVANAEYTKHTCTRCGETHDAITVDNDAHSISACHGFGSVTLKAPTENLTYDGTAKEAAVEGVLTGIDTPKILYKLKDSSEAAAETAPVNAGTYVASITYSISGTDYSVSVEYTIEQADDVPNRPNDDLYGCIGAKLSTVSLENYEGWSWDNPGFALTENAWNITVKASYNGADKDNYKNITAVDVTINLRPHNYTNGFCEYCGGIAPAQLVGRENHPELIGTHDGYYVIENVGQLYWFAGLVNGTLEGVTRNKSANAVLTDNITVNKGVLDTNGNPNSGTFRNWTPICEFDTNDDTGYSGTFDGNNKTISGLYFNDTNTGFIGLFGYLSGTVKNVGVVDSYFNGKTYVGGVCGSTCRGTIQNCYNTATVNGTMTAGGVCGYNTEYSRIINCYNVGAVSGGSNVGGVCGLNSSSTITNCYYLASKDDKNGGKEETQFKSSEVAYLLAQGCTAGETFYDGSVWGQKLGVNDYPVPGSPYMLITTAYKKEDGTYWATFSDQSSDVTLSVPSTRTLKVYNATVSAGTMTLRKRDDNQVAMGEGVLLKTDGKYVNVKANDIPDWLTKLDYWDNNLVATPETAGPVGGDVDYTLYRLTYNTIQNEDNLGFYLGVATVKGITYRDGFYVNATPGKAYLKALTSEAKIQSTAYLARGFAFPGDDGETTGIECITATDESLHSNGNAEGIFDLQGRKVSKPMKGVYINNGKKVIIK